MSKQLPAIILFAVTCLSAGGAAQAGVPIVATASPPAGKIYVTGQTFTATWTFQNTSAKSVAIAWAINRTTASRFCDLNHQAINLVVAPGKTFTLSLPMRAPEVPGGYTETWRLLDTALNSLSASFSASITAQAPIGPPNPPLPTSAFREGRFLYPLGNDRYRPVAPLINSAFGDWIVDSDERYWGHLGEDLKSRYGDPVYSIGNGFVTFAGPAANGWGNVVIIAHQDPRVTYQPAYFFSVYAHLSKMTVKKNDLTNWFTKIGEVGDAGGLWDPHLHFALQSHPTELGPGYSRRIFNDDVMAVPGYNIAWERPSKFLRAFLCRP